MRRFSMVVALLLSVTGAVSAADLVLDFESYSVGPLVGQDNWTCCFAGAGVGDTTGFNIVGEGSPLNGSTKSVRISGVSTGNRVFRPLASTINSGIYQVGYDFTHSGQLAVGGVGMVMRVPFYTPGHAGLQQVIQPYAQNGGGGAAAFNGFFDVDGLGATGYGGTSMGGGGLLPHKWYRIEFLMDFDKHYIYDIISFEIISSGQKVMMSMNPGPLYFRNDGTNWVNDFGELGLGYDATPAEETWNFDNFSMVAIAHPADVLVNFEPTFGYTTGPIVGQPVGAPATWTCCGPQTGSDTTGYEVSSQVRSPNPSYGTQSAMITGNGSSNRIFLPLTQYGTISSGHYQVGYDFTHSGQGAAASNMVMNVLFYTPGHAEAGNLNQVVRLYAQNGGGGAAAFNGFFDLDGLGPLGYGGTGMGSGGLLPRIDPTGGADHWYRLEFLIDFDAHYVYNIKSYDITGNNQKNQIGEVNPGPLYFHNDSGNWINSFGELGIGFNVANPDENWNIDNFSVLKVPRPLPIINEVKPDPQHVVVGSSYSQQLSLLFPFLQVTWSVVDGPTGITVDANGLVSGWTPSLAQVGTTQTITIQAANAGGSDTETWQVVVNAVPTVDGSNPAAPWGSLNGGPSCPQSSSDPALTFSAQWSKGVSQDWSLAMTGNLASASERGGITFDEAGNLYWRTTTGFLASVSPAGADRWSGYVGHDAGTPVSLGMADESTPVVGGGGPTGRVYVLRDGGAAAFRKSNGQKLWSTDLPDSGFSITGDRLTPVLYNGILYVVGSGNPSKVVYALNASNGQIVWDTLIPVNLDLGWGDAKGSMAFVPNVFGAGIGGLYFNADGAGSGAADMFALKIDTNLFSGKLQWTANGGKSASSHPVYSSVTGRLYTDTWSDDGEGNFYAFDAVTGARTTSGGEASGYNDFTALDFNGTDILASGSDGRFTRYHDTGDGTTTAVVLSGNPLYGEERMYGGLYRSPTGDSIVLAAGRGPGEPIYAFNLTQSPAAGGPIAEIFNYATGLSSSGDSYVRGLQLGPASAGQPERIFYFQGVDALVALKYPPQIPGDFDENGFVDNNDYPLFLDCVNLGNGPEVPLIGANCANRDIDGDGDIDQDDFGIWQRCFRGASPADPNCAN